MKRNKTLPQALAPWVDMFFIQARIWGSLTGRSILKIQWYWHYVDCSTLNDTDSWLDLGAAQRRDTGVRGEGRQFDSKYNQGTPSIVANVSIAGILAWPALVPRPFYWGGECAERERVYASSIISTYIVLYRLGPHTCINQLIKDPSGLVGCILMAIPA